MKGLQQQAIERWQATKRIIKSFIEFLDAACLTAVAGYAVYESLRHTGLWYKGLLFAGVVIGLQAFVLFVRHFNSNGGGVHATGIPTK